MAQYTQIGRLLDHSLDPVVYRLLLDQAGMEADYTSVSLERAELGEEAAAWLGTLDGFQVAWPFQEAILPFVRAVDPVGQASGWITAVRREPDGSFTGINTVVDGLLGALGDRGLSLEGKVCVVGCGKRARAFAGEALSRGGRVTLAVLPHQWLEARETVERMAARHPANPPRLLLTDQLEEEWDLLVNATPAGMYPRVDELPVPLEALVKTRAVFDMVYNPSTTLLIREAARCGCGVAGGAGMMVHQAARTISFWGGAAFPREELARLTALVENLTTPAVAMDLEGSGSIALCGFLGAGKETAGRLLAKRTGRRFVSLEQLIARKVGGSPAQALARLGEGDYARLENRLVEELCALPGLVISVGCRAAVHPRNLPHLRRCRLVFLDTPFNYCLARMDHGHPLASGREDGELYRLYANWYPLWYWISHNRVDGRGTPQEVADRIHLSLRTNQEFC